MKKMKKLCILLSALMLTTALSVVSACKEEDAPPVTPPGGEDVATDFVFPADDSTITWKTPSFGDGSPFFEGNSGRYSCVEGYYRVDLLEGQELFYEFSVSQTGLYALYTTSAVENLTITQYDASVQYIPQDSSGAFIGEEAQTVPSSYTGHAGALYAKINCSAKYYSAQWRATFGILSTKNQTVELRFVRIGDALTEPETITTPVSANEIKGKYLRDENPDADITGKDLVAVPFGSDFFYDEDYEIYVTPLDGGTPVKAKGFYRMGTEEKPGALIYVAISENYDDRMFDTTFVGLADKGASLNIQVATAENGDFLVNDYANFIMRADGDEEKICYENAVNNDGLYPVNQELFDFLNYYVKVRGCSALTDQTEQNTYADTMWLAPCFYYGNMKNGSSQYPYELVTGENTITLSAEEYVYYKIRWVKTTNANTGTDITAGYYKLTCSDPNVIVKFLNDESRTNYRQPEALAFQADYSQGATLQFLYDGTETEKEFTVTVEKADGYLENPCVILENNATITTEQWLNSQFQAEYFVVYNYFVQTAGTLSITTDIDAGATLQINGQAIENATTLDVSVGDFVEIILSGAQAGLSADLTFTIA